MCVVCSVESWPLENDVDKLYAYFETSILILKILNRLPCHVPIVYISLLILKFLTIVSSFFGNISLIYFCNLKNVVLSIKTWIYWWSKSPSWKGWLWYTFKHNESSCIIALNFLCKRLVQNRKEMVATSSAYEWHLLVHNSFVTSHWIEKTNLECESIKQF